jgi:uncharacterized coiled-coil protein SlyX
MAVPSAVTRRAERDAAELRDAGFDPNGAPLAVQAPLADPTVLTSVPAPAVATNDDPAALKARIAELEAAASTQNGRVSASAQDVASLKQQLEISNGNRSFLEGKLTELTEKVNAMETENATLKNTSTVSAVDKAVADLAGASITEQDRAEFGDSIDMVQRVTKAQMAAVVGPLVERLKVIESAMGRLKELDKLPSLEESARVASIEAARNKELEFLRKEILPHYPDFETVRATEQWKNYLGQDVPGRGIKIGHLLRTYRQTMDADGIRSVLAAYYDKHKSKPTLDSLAVPAKTGADAPQAPAPTKIKASEYKQNLRDFTSKKMPKADWEAFRARWDQAITSGNVEMDVEIR